MKPTAAKIDNKSYKCQGDRQLDNTGATTLQAASAFQQNVQEKAKSTRPAAKPARRALGAKTPPKRHPTLKEPEAASHSTCRRRVTLVGRDIPEASLSRGVAVADDADDAGATARLIGLGPR